MTVDEVILRYQSYDPLTGRFDVARTRADYARLLGVHPAQVTRLAQRRHRMPVRMAQGLARVFPAARADLQSAVLPREWVA